MKLEQIYVRLSLSYERAGQERVSIGCDELFSNGDEKTRYALLGEAGVGKTTLLYKIAYDWAIGERLKHIDLLLFVPMREVQQYVLFEEILKSLFPNRLRLDNTKMYEYIRSNEAKVMLLLDGLDEYKRDANLANVEGDPLKILKGDILQRTSVIVTTRPWRAEQLTRIEDINNKFTNIYVKGFEQRDIPTYINNFINHNPAAASSLIDFVKKGNLVAQTMVLHPIFCCMLCHMWSMENVSDRQRVKDLQTFSELIKEMIDTLVAQYAAKLEDDVEEIKTRCAGSLKGIGEAASSGFLEIPHSDEQVMNRDVKTGRKLGIVLPNDRVVSGEVSFPHKLVQEYLVGLFLASLFHEDQNNCKSLITSQILENTSEHANLLSFTAFHAKKNRDDGELLITFLCDSLNIELNAIGKDEFLMVDVGFECHDEKAIKPIVDTFMQKTSMVLYGPNTLITGHTFLGYMYILAACGHSMVRSFL